MSLEELVPALTLPGTPDVSFVPSGLDHSIHFGRGVS